MNWDSGLEDITLVSPLVSTRLSVGSNPRVSFREDTKTSGGNPEGPNPGHEHDFFLLVVFVLQGPFFQDSPRLRRHPTLVDHFPNISFWGFPQEAGP